VVLFCVVLQWRTVSLTTELKVPPDAAFVSLVQSFAHDAAQRSGLSESEQDRLAEAARRGFAAIVEEAMARAREPLRIVATCAPSNLTLAFFERGLPIDDALARRDPRWNEIVECVDTANWKLHGTSGSELRLVVNRPHGETASTEPAQRGETDVPLAPAQEYTIRRFAPRDAEGIARAFYLTYGYAYDFSAVYVPDRLIELNQSGCYVSIVAVTASGDVVGHYALARDGDAPIADACAAVVLPEHRGRDLLNRLRAKAELEAIALGLEAYYSEPVTDHGRTQHASESFGAKACGITLGEAPRSFIAKHMELSTTSQRQSCMLYVKPLQPREPRAIYVPEHHRAIVERIYEELDVPVKFGKMLQRGGHGAFHTSLARRDATATVQIESVGAQTPELVGQTVADLQLVRRLGAIYALLPLEDPGMPRLCEVLESRGMFFAGVGPWSLGGKDALRLQMPLTPIDLDALVVVGEFGKTILEYVGRERARCSNNRTRTTAGGAQSGLEQG